MNDFEPDEQELWDDPLFQALRAPGTPAELASEQEMVAAFRAARPAPSNVRRLVGRLGVGGTAVVASVALSSGVAAAAYTRVLPEPIQRIAHDVFGPVGVPEAPVAAKKVRPRPTPTVAPPSPSPVRPTKAPATGKDGKPAKPEATPTATPTEVVPGVVPSDGATADPSLDPSATPTPSGTPTGTPSPTGTPTPTPTPTPTSTFAPALVPAKVGASVSDPLVAYRSDVNVSGVVTDAQGLRLRNRTVVLWVRSASDDAWHEAAEGVTAKDGSVRLNTGLLEENTDVQLRVGRLVSNTVAVSVQPAMTLTVTDDVLVVETFGAQEGDTVVLQRRKAGRLVTIGKGVLNDSGEMTFILPPTALDVRFVVRLRATELHAGAKAAVIA